MATLKDVQLFAEPLLTDELYAQDHPLQTNDHKIFILKCL